MSNNLRYSVILLVTFLSIYYFVQNNVKKKSERINALELSKQEYLAKQEAEKKIWETVYDAGESIDISSHIIKRSSNVDGLGFQAWHFQEPLLPLARLGDFRMLEDRFWFSGKSGLVSFDPESEKWFVLNRDNGLPGDTAFQIELDQGGLLLDVSNISGRNTLTQVGNFHFKDNQFKATKTNILRAKAGSVEFPKTTKFTSRVSDVLKQQDRIWFSYRGSQDEGGKKFVNGGVAVKINEDSIVEEFTVEDGLSSSYCNSLISTSDGTVWVSHWRTHLGISRYIASEKRWEVIRKSANGVELGGMSLHSQGPFLFIAQLQGLVIYNTESKYALFIGEKEGLPGYTVWDVQFDSNGAVWASSSGLKQNGLATTGLTKIDFEAIKRYFLDKEK